MKEKKRHLMEIFKKVLVVGFITALMVLAGCGESTSEGYDGHALVGAWRSDGFTQYTFNADGTGVRAFGHRDFTWRILRSGNLRITIDGTHSEFVLTFQEEAGTHRRRPVNSNSVSVFHPMLLPEYLHGTWVWDEDPNYTIVFDDVGRGNRGFDDNREQFRWLIDDDGGRNLFILIGMTYEPWFYRIEDDVLTITSRIRNRSHVQFSYIRVED